MHKIIDENVIKNFIKDDVVAKGFLELYSYCKKSVPKSICDIRDNLIGVKVDGERLRFYFNKLTNDKWYIKIKDDVRELFDISNLDVYKKAIDSLNKKLQKNPTKNKLKSEAKPNSYLSEHVIMRNGKLQIKLYNWEIKDLDKLLKEIDYLKCEGIKKVNLDITQK